MSGKKPSILYLSHCKIKQAHFLTLWVKPKILYPSPPLLTQIASKFHFFAIFDKPGKIPIFYPQKHTHVHIRTDTQTNIRVAWK